MKARLQMPKRAPLSKPLEVALPEHKFRKAPAVDKTLSRFKPSHHPTSRPKDTKRTFYSQSRADEFARLSLERKPKNSLSRSKRNHSNSSNSYLDKKKRADSHAKASRHAASKEYLSTGNQGALRYLAPGPRKLKSVSSREQLKEHALNGRQSSSCSDRPPFSYKLYRSMDLLEEPAQPPRTQEKFTIKHSYRTKAGKLASNPGKVNQDVQFVQMGFQGKKHLFAVGDGHGQLGHEVSGFIKKRYPAILQGDAALASSPLKALSRSF
jgi:hypothetical protein